MTGDAVDPLTVHRNPVRMLTGVGPWLAAVYLASYVIAGTALFVLSVVTLAVTGVLGLFTLGVPVLAGSALVVRGCAQVERARVRLVGAVPEARYREVAGLGVLARVQARWTDRTTWRDVAYLVLLYPPLLLLDAVALLIWSALIAGVTIPVWLRIRDLPTTIALAATCAVLAVFAAYLVVVAARLHRGVVSAVLGPYRDPLAAAKRILAEPCSAEGIEPAA
jgi:hypothetical protein